MTADGITPETFRVVHLGETVPAEAGPENDIRFYAQTVDNEFTGTNVCWLYQEKGETMVRTDGEPPEGDAATSFGESLSFEENHQLWEGRLSFEEKEGDYWYWSRIHAPAAPKYSVNIPLPVRDEGDAVIRVWLRGRSDAPLSPDHHTRISLNGTLISDEHWDGFTEHIQEVGFSPDLLLNGSNTITIESPGDTEATVDEVWLNRIAVAYRRAFVATEDHLRFTVTDPGPVRIEISGFTQAGILLYDITDPYQVTRFSSFLTARLTRPRSGIRFCPGRLPKPITS